MSVGKVRSEPYCFDDAKIIIRETTDRLIHELVEKRLVTDQVVLTVGCEKP